MTDLFVAAADVVTPGQRLASAKGYKPGPGAYYAPNTGFLHASLLGTVGIEPAGDGDSEPRISVVNSKSAERALVPQIGDIVTARVTKINPNLANLTVLALGSKVLTEPFEGTLRASNIRATEIDKVVLYECFRPGDIVLAKIISIGHSRSSYMASTADNDLGVIYALSEAGGVPMIPMAWDRMQCPKTGASEPRKVARVLPQSVLAALMSSGD